MENFPPFANTPGAARPGALHEPEPQTEANRSAHKAGNTLRHELGELKSDLDALMSHEATLSDGELGEAYARILARLGAASAVARIAAHEVEPRHHADQPTALERVRQRPLLALAAASGAGLAAGWLTRRYRDHRH